MKHFLLNCQSLSLYHCISSRFSEVWNESSPKVIYTKNPNETHFHSIEPFTFEYSPPSLLPPKKTRCGSKRWAVHELLSVIFYFKLMSRSTNTSLTELHRHRFAIEWKYQTSRSCGRYVIDMSSKFNWCKYLRENLNATNNVARLNRNCEKKKWIDLNDKILRMWLSIEY